MSYPHNIHPRRPRRGVPTLLIIAASLVLSVGLIAALTALFKLVAGVVS